MSKPLSLHEQRGAFHSRHVAYHQKAAADHAGRGEGERRHQAAATAHEALTDGRDDKQAEGAALRLSNMAEQESFQAKKNRGR